MIARRFALASGVAALAIAMSPAALASGQFRERPSAHQVASVETVVEDVKAEVRIGKDIAARILGRYRLYENQKLLRYVNLVGRSVALHADRPEVEFHFAVLDTDSINAYAAPGGYIFVTRGALKNMRNEAELAAVLAHEVAHVTQKHIVKELKIRGSEKSAESGITHLLGGSGDTARAAFELAVDKAVGLLLESGLKQEDELEADKVGTLILANSGYDATALRSYLERIKALQGEQVNVLHTTHPPFEKRLAELDALMSAEGLDAVAGGQAEHRFKNYLN